MKIFNRNVSILCLILLIASANCFAQGSRAGVLQIARGNGIMTYMPNPGEPYLDMTDNRLYFGKNIGWLWFPDSSYIASTMSLKISVTDTGGAGLVNFWQLAAYQPAGSYWNHSDTTVTGTGITSQAKTKNDSIYWWNGNYSPVFTNITLSGLLPGFVPYRTATIFANSPIYTDGTNVGIRTTTPSYPLSVVSGNALGLEIVNSGSSNKSWRLKPTGNDLQVVETSGNVAGSMTFQAGGNVGIETATPYHANSIATTTAGWAIFDKSFNKRYDSQAQEEDTSCAFINFDTSGRLSLTARGPYGNTKWGVDTAGIGSFADTIKAGVGISSTGLGRISGNITVNADTATTLMSKSFGANQYQPKGTYLVPSDTIFLHNNFGNFWQHIDTTVTGTGITSQQKTKNDSLANVAASLLKVNYSDTTSALLSSATNSGFLSYTNFVTFNLWRRNVTAPHTGYLTTATTTDTLSISALNVTGPVMGINGLTPVGNSFPVIVYKIDSAGVGAMNTVANTMFTPSSAVHHWECSVYLNCVIVDAGTTWTIELGFRDGSPDTYDFPAANTAMPGIFNLPTLSFRTSDNTAITYKVIVTGIPPQIVNYAVFLKMLD